MNYVDAVAVKTLVRESLAASEKRAKGESGMFGLNDKLVAKFLSGLKEMLDKILDERVVEIKNPALAEPIQLRFPRKEV